MERLPYLVVSTWPLQKKEEKPPPGNRQARKGVVELAAALGKDAELQVSKEGQPVVCSAP